MTIPNDSVFVQSMIDRWVNGSINYPLQPGKYYLGLPISIALTAPRSGLALPWSGVEFISTITDPSKDVFEITTASEFRGLQLDGLKITGSGKERHAINVHCSSNTAFIEKWVLSRLILEAVGGDGLHIEGNVFQGSVEHAAISDCAGNGAAFVNIGTSAVVSAIGIHGGSFDQNGKSGIYTPYPGDDGLSAGPCDILVERAYARNNKGAGYSWGNGFNAMIGCGAENNWDGAPDFAHGDAGIVSSGGGILFSCKGSTNAKQTHLVRSFLPDGGSLVIGNGCGVVDESWPAGQTPIRLCNVTGTGKLWIAPDCVGECDVGATVVRVA